MVTFIAVFLLGWIAGGLINYLSDALPYKRKLVLPFCVKCDASRSILSLLLPIRCPGCQNPVPVRWYLVNFLSILAALVLFYYPSHPLGFVLGFCFFIYIAIVAVIDIEHRLILFPVSIFGLLAGSVLGIGLHGFWATLLGGAAGFAAMLLLYYLGGLFAKGIAKMRRQSLDEPALGFGDVMLSGVLGLVLGWPGITAGLILAILFGGFFSAIIIVSRLLKKTYTPFLAIPYGPFLILGTVVLLYRFY